MNITSVLVGAGAGAGLMYLLDPDLGNRRRALMRDQLVRAGHVTGDAVDVTSRDVIHSFWIPALSGKRDAAPGRVHPLWFQADQPGRYLGQCTEFCGLSHGYMRMLVDARSPEDFEAWVERQAADAAAPVSASERDGFEVLQSSCSYCHTVRGTGLSGDVGPDLTHVASRLELAAHDVRIEVRGRAGDQACRADRGRGRGRLELAHRATEAVGYVGRIAPP